MFPFAHVGSHAAVGRFAAFSRPSPLSCANGLFVLCRMGDYALVLGYGTFNLCLVFCPPRCRNCLSVVKIVVSPHEASSIAISVQNDKKQVRKLLDHNRVPCLIRPRLFLLQKSLFLSCISPCMLLTGASPLALCPYRLRTQPAFLSYSNLRTMRGL